MPDRFPVGSRVFLVSEKLSAWPGATATVVGYDDNFAGFINVKWDTTPLRGNQMHGGYDKRHFELLDKNADIVNSLIELARLHKSLEEKLQSLHGKNIKSTATVV